MITPFHFVDLSDVSSQSHHRPHEFFCSLDADAQLLCRLGTGIHRLLLSMGWYGVVKMKKTTSTAEGYM